MKKIYTLASLLLALVVSVQAAQIKASGQKVSLRQRLSTQVSTTDNESRPDKFLNACKEGDLKSVERYLNRNERKKDFDINSIRDEFGNTPLILASAHGQKAVVERLLKVPGIKVDTRRLGTGMTALMYALAHEHLDIAKLLVEQASVKIKDYEGMTPLMHAARTRNEDMVTLVLSALRKRNQIEQVVNVQDEKGRTALIHACEVPQKQQQSGDRVDPIIQRLVLSGGADINISDINGQTPLMHVAITGDRLAFFTLMYGLDPFTRPKCDEQDVEGTTALMHAIISLASALNRGADRKEIVERKRLISDMLEADKKPNVLLQDKQGMTAMDYAELTDDSTLSGMLEIMANEQKKK